MDTRTVKIFGRVFSRKLVHNVVVIKTFVGIGIVIAVFLPSHIAPAFGAAINLLWLIKT